MTHNWPGIHTHAHIHQTYRHALYSIQHPLPISSLILHTVTLRKHKYISTDHPLCLVHPFEQPFSSQFAQVLMYAYCACIGRHFSAWVCRENRHYVVYDACLHCWRLCTAPDECVLFHTILISLFRLLSRLHSSTPPFLVLSPLYSSFSLPCPSCFVAVTVSLTLLPVRPFSLLFLTNTSLHLCSPTFYTSPSITDGKQVQFTQFISSFPPCCFVAVVPKWRVYREI